MSINGTEFPLTDRLRWKDVALDGKRSGSMRTDETAFDPIYGLRYFVYDVDTHQHTLELRRLSDDRLMATLHYLQPDTACIALASICNQDSVRVLLRRSPHHFQLNEQQFQWLSELNR